MLHVASIPTTNNFNFTMAPPPSRPGLTPCSSAIEFFLGPGQSEQNDPKRVEIGYTVICRVWFSRKVTMVTLGACTEANPGGRGAAESTEAAAILVVA